MSETKWMPGPWWFGEPEPRTGRIVVISRPTATGVAFAFRGEEAALIAAAPDLYEALERVEASMRDRRRNREPHNARLHAAVRAALARARGETP